MQGGWVAKGTLNAWSYNCDMVLSGEPRLVLEIQC